MLQLCINALLITRCGRFNKEADAKFCCKCGALLADKGADDDDFDPTAAGNSGSKQGGGAF